MAADVEALIPSAPHSCRATCPASEPCRACAKVRILPRKIFRVVLWGHNCPKFRRTCPASEPRQPADVEASIPSVPGTQLMMSHMLSPTTKQCPIMSDTGSIVQVSLLTGAIGQIKLSHIRKKPWRGPGAGLVRAWCGPGAGLVRAPRPKPRSSG